MFTLTFRYSAEFRRRFARRAFWRAQWLRLLEIGALLAVGITVSLLLHIAWTTGFVAGMAFGLLAAFSGAYRRLGAGPAVEAITATISERGLGVAVDGYSAETAWRTITALRRTTDGLALKGRYSRGSLLLPAAVLTPEIEAFINRQFAESRGAGRAREDLPDGDT